MADCGIYQIRALHSDEVYIGSSIDLERRKKDHFRFLRYGTHDNPKLQASYNKYGKDNFVFEVLLLCDPENCLDLEQEHFDKFLPHFNIAKKAGKPPSRKGTTWECTEEQRNIRAASMKEAAIKRGIKQRKATEKKLESVCKELHESGLSIRKFIQEYNPPVSRCYLNKAYRKFTNGLKETAA